MKKLKQLKKNQKLKNCVVTNQLIFEIVHISDSFSVAIELKPLLVKYGFTVIQSTSICVAVSELVSNICKYAQKGKLIVEMILSGSDKGVQITAIDKGKGIEDWEKVFEEGYSTGGSLGLGLPGIKRIMDEIYFDRQREVGVKISIRKWI